MGVGPKNGPWTGWPDISRGAESVRAIVRASREIGISYLTLFAFSSENWSRPAGGSGSPHDPPQGSISTPNSRRCWTTTSVFWRSGISAACPKMSSDPATKPSSRRPRRSRDDLDLGLELWREGRYSPGHPPDHGPLPGWEPRPGGAYTKTSSPNTSGPPTCPIPDLLIRTSGEMRISNFFLWQLAYTEIYVTSTLWPDFDRRGTHPGPAELSGTGNAGSA